MCGCGYVVARKQRIPGVCVWICAVCGTTEPSACVNVTRNIKPQGSLEEQTHA